MCGNLLLVILSPSLLTSISEFLQVVLTVGVHTPAQLYTFGKTVLGYNDRDKALRFCPKVTLDLFSVLSTGTPPARECDCLGHVVHRSDYPRQETLAEHVALVFKQGSLVANRPNPVT